MAPSRRATLVQTLSDAMPLEAAASVDCPCCDPSGGCPDPRGCTEAFCGGLVDLLERELARMGVAL